MTAHAPKRRREAQPLHLVHLHDALLKLQTAATVAGLSVPTLYRLAKSDPTFPKFIKMGQRCTRIRAGDLTAWLAAQTGA